MYCIIVYDVKVKRVQKLCKFLRQYLFWTQNSVFEGELSEAEIFKIKIEIEKLINKDEDSVIIFTFPRPKWINREIIGKEKGSNSQFL
ncbi:MAG: CRISPR-associated endonuclease Cas2 [candidate division WOR-3 bacterium]